MSKLGVIINPLAKKNLGKKDKLRHAMEDIGGKNVVVRITQHLDAIYNAANDFIDEGVEILGVSGGDGSLHHTLSRFIEVYRDRNAPLPKLLPLKGGTMNMVFNSVGMRGDSIPIVHRLFEGYKRGETPKMIKRKTMAAGEHYCFLCGLGMSANFLDAYYTGPGTGPLKAAWILSYAVSSMVVGGNFAKQLFAPIECELYDGETKLHLNQFTAILAATIPNLGIGFKPTYRALETTETYHVLIVDLTPMQVLPIIPKLFFGRPLDRPEDTYDNISKSMRIKTENRFIYFLDGELYRTNDLTLNLGPTFEVIVV